MALKVFCSYAHKDEKKLIELKKHLSPLQRHGFIELWYDRNINAGTEREPEIAKHLNSAQIILLLISADFIASDYCYGKEMKRALERHECGQARVIPIILRPVKWQYESFRKLQALPTNSKAISTWSNKDRAFEDVTEGIARVVEELSTPELLVSSKQSQATHLKRRKALLVLTSGRPLPDILTLLYLQPELVIVIASQEGWQFQKIIADIAHTLPYCEVSIVGNANVYSMDTSIQTYIEACLPYRETEWEWTFTVSSATKIMALAGYELARQKGISCWQVDLLRERVFSLVKETEIDTQRFFHLPISVYMSAFGYEVAIGRLVVDYQSKLEAWSNIAQEVVHSSDAETIFHLLRKTGDKTILSQELKTSVLVQSLASKGLLRITEDSNKDTLEGSFTSHTSAYFLGGGWLELYVWYEVIKANFADDCQWGLQFVKGGVRFEIDLALTHKARLLITECSTASNTFITDDKLAKLDSVANLLGGSYVSKVFITNQSSTHPSYKLFYERAKLRNIVVITKEDLLSIGIILKQEMSNPAYVRI